jgi:hypothetical protein
MAIGATHGLARDAPLEVKSMPYIPLRTNYTLPFTIIINRKPG